MSKSIHSLQSKWTLELVQIGDAHAIDLLYYGKSYRVALADDLDEEA